MTRTDGPAGVRCPPLPFVNSQVQRINGQRSGNGLSQPASEAPAWTGNAAVLYRRRLITRRRNLPDHPPQLAPVPWLDNPDRRPARTRTK